MHDNQVRLFDIKKELKKTRLFMSLVPIIFNYVIIICTSIFLLDQCTNNDVILWRTISYIFIYANLTIIAIYLLTNGNKSSMRHIISVSSLILLFDIIWCIFGSYVINNTTDQLCYTNKVSSLSYFNFITTVSFCFAYITMKDDKYYNIVPPADPIMQQNNINIMEQQQEGRQEGAPEIQGEPGV